jgi:flagellar hook-associated protein 1 FlgK
MGGTSLMSLGVRTMFAASASMQTTGHNIANASVEGYSRQRVELESSKGQFTGAGFFGKGVDVVTVSRAYNEHLTREAAQTASQAAHDKTRAEQLARLELVFPMGESGIGYAASQMFGAISDVASRPEDIPSRQVVLSRAGELAARFNAAGDQIDALQRGVNTDLKVGIDEVNSLAERIADVNQQVAAMKGSGQTPNDLLDLRDQLVQKLSNLIPVSAVEAQDGSMSVFLSGGQRLVLSNQVSRLMAGIDPDDASRTAIYMREAGGARLLPNDEMFPSGSVGGLLRFQNTDLAQARTMREGMAQALVDTINTQMQAGVDLDGNAGEPLFSISPTTFRVEVTMKDPRKFAAASPGSDNANALALAALRDESFVPGTVFGESAGTSYRITDAYAMAMADIGVRVQSARTSSQISAAVARTASENRSSTVGVNLDEEAAMLIQYQQSYQAAAKVLQIAQSVFETLLETAGR